MSLDQSGPFREGKNSQLQWSYTPAASEYQIRAASMETAIHVRTPDEVCNTHSVLHNRIVIINHNPLLSFQVITAPTTATLQTIPSICTPNS